MNQLGFTVSCLFVVINIKAYFQGKKRKHIGRITVVKVFLFSQHLCSVGTLSIQKDVEGWNFLYEATDLLVYCSFLRICNDSNLYNIFFNLNKHMNQVTKKIQAEPNLSILLTQSWYQKEFNCKEIVDKRKPLITLVSLSHPFCSHHMRETALYHHRYISHC